jgi:hypothetical protein
MLCYGVDGFYKWNGYKGSKRCNEFGSKKKMEFKFRPWLLPSVIMFAAQVSTRELACGCAGQWVSPSSAGALRVTRLKHPRLTCQCRWNDTQNAHNSDAFLRNITSPLIKKYPSKKQNGPKIIVTTLYTVVISYQRGYFTVGAWHKGRSANITKRTYTWRKVGNGWLTLRVKNISFSVLR